MKCSNNSKCGIVQVTERASSNHTSRFWVLLDALHTIHSRILSSLESLDDILRTRGLPAADFVSVLDTCRVVEFGKSVTLMVCREPVSAAFIHGILIDPFVCLMYITNPECYFRFHHALPLLKKTNFGMTTTSAPRPIKRKCPEDEPSLTQ